MIFVGKTHRDAVASECPQLLDKPVIQFPDPLPLQEGNDLLSSGGELRAVSPARIDAVSQGDFFGIARVPAIFCLGTFCLAVCSLNGGNGGRELIVVCSLNLRTRAGRGQLLAQCFALLLQGLHALLNCFHAFANLLNRIPGRDALRAVPVIRFHMNDEYPLDRDLFAGDTNAVQPIDCLSRPRKFPPVRVS